MAFNFRSDSTSLKLSLFTCHFSSPLSLTFSNGFLICRINETVILFSDKFAVIYRMREWFVMFTVAL